MCKEIQETPKSCPVSSPYATPTLTAALSAEYSTGAATVHHLQQHGVRRQEVLSRNPADGTPHRVTVHSADWPGFRETVAHGRPHVRPGCRGRLRLIQSARHQIQTPMAPGNRYGARSSVSRWWRGAGSCGSINSSYSRGTQLQSSSSRLASVWCGCGTHRPTARSIK